MDEWLFVIFHPPRILASSMTIGIAAAPVLVIETIRAR
jgi:hypothetical protein